MRILLLRHGITEANEKHLYCGSTDLPLSPVRGNFIIHRNIFASAAGNARAGHALHYERHAPLQ